MSVEPIEIQAWETEYGSVIAWGTHDPEAACPVVNEFFVDYCDEHGVGNALIGEWRKYWGHEALPLIEEWPRIMTSNEPVEGWVPYMVAIP